MLSFWERESLTHADVLIIGAGIVGLSTAVSIKEKHPHLTVMVFERGLLPSGASTRNAGFTTFGGVGEMLHDIQIMGEAAVVDLVTRRWEGLRILRRRLGDEAIGYQNHGGYELVFRDETQPVEAIEQLNELLWPLFKDPVFSLSTDPIAKFQFNPNFLQYSIYTPFEGQIHTGMMMQALYQKALSLGVMIKTGALVQAIKKQAHQVTLEVMGASSEDRVEFHGGQCVVCTNAFATQFFPEMDIVPGRGQVLVTEPIPNLPFKGIFHFDEGYYYFRNIGQRVLFGGGRNLDFQKERTTEMALNHQIQKKLDYYLSNLILPRIKYRVDMRWSGIMAFGHDKNPIVKRIDERVIAGVRMNGIGVALASLVGEEIAGML